MFGFFDSANVNVAKNCTKIIEAMSDESRTYHEQAFAIIYAAFEDEFGWDFILHWNSYPIAGKKTYRDKLFASPGKLGNDPAFSRMCFTQMALFFGFFLKFLDDEDKAAISIMSSNLMDLATVARQLRPTCPF